MKGLDTPLVLDLLRGRPSARKVVGTFEGEELCTTEINLFELETLARLDRRPGRERRLAALERLRSKLTILPIDQRAARAAAVLAATQPRSASASEYLILGAAEAAGVSEWLTTTDLPVPKAPSKLKIRKYSRTVSK